MARLTRLHYVPVLFECKCCGKMLPEFDFGRQSYTGTRTSQCKNCMNIKRSVVRNKSKHGKFISKEKQRAMETPDYLLQDWQDAMIHFGGECPICGCKEGRAKASKFDRDHIIPVSKGGKTFRNNVMPCCRRDNRGRGNRDIFEWFRNQTTWTQAREDRIRAWMEQE